MPDNLLAQARVDRRAFAVTSFAEAERADGTRGPRTNAWSRGSFATPITLPCLCLLAGIPDETWSFSMDEALRSGQR